MTVRSRDLEAPGVLAGRRMAVLALSLGVVLLFASGDGFSAKPGFPERNLIKDRTPAGYEVVQGGLSFVEKEFMESRFAPYGLRLKFTRRSGVPLFAAVLFVGEKQSGQVQRIVVRAPWLYLKVPAGGYVILARIENKLLLIPNVEVREGYQQTYMLRGD